jgi:Zn finger protein HypA/HybF involved in hydrogenase expression
MVECPYCGKNFSSKGIDTHIKRSHEDSSSWDNQKELLHSLKVKKGIKNKFPNGKPAWNVGLKGDKRFVSNPEFLNEEIFVENGTYPRHRLKHRLIRDKLIEYRCEICSNVGIWNNKPLSLQIDHINGVNNDNRIDNLRFLCPNCHSQTETYAGKNNKKNKDIL